MATAEAPGNIDLEMWRNEWLERLSALIDCVESWVKELGWSTRRIEKQLEDSEIGSHSVPALILQEETTRALLEPIARSAPGAEGIVDLYLMPAYDDIATLYFCDGRWQLRYMISGTPSALDRNADLKPLSKETIHEVLEEMKKNAAQAR